MYYNYNQDTELFCVNYVKGMKYQLEWHEIYRHHSWGAGNQILGFESFITSCLPSLEKYPAPALARGSGYQEHHNRLTGIRMPRACSLP